MKPHPLSLSQRLLNRPRSFPPFKYKYIPHNQSIKSSNLHHQNMFTASDHSHQMLQYHPLHQLEPSSLPNNANAIIMERELWKPNVEIAPNCPRCASINTKFCYYNNYSLSQPRYFCKGCRRYWTKGGSLRNVPVGGGCRKNRRAKSAKRVSENYNKSLNDRPIASCSSDDSTVGPNGGSDIDLAVVFAKFLNESSSSHMTELDLANTSNSTTPDSVLGEANLNIIEGFPRVFEQQEEDMSAAYELQALLSNETVDQDALWSEQAEAEAEAETETFPNFTWQPMFQFPDFDSFPADGQLKTSTNLIGDNNWSSFDLSGFEVYSRP